MKKLSLVLAIALASGQLFAQTINKSKFGKGLKFMAEDSSFTMKFHYRQQQLFEAQLTEKGNADDALSSNFMVRRSRLKFSGNAFTSKLTYKAELGLTSKDISTSKENGNTGGASRLILDAVLKYQFSKHWALWIGQTKLPGNRERVISSANLQFVNRSSVNSKFNIDRDAGLQLRGKYSLGKVIFKPSFAVTKGEGRGISSSNIGGYDYTAHLDILPFGKFAGKKGDYVSSALTREKTFKTSIGLTYDYNDRASRQGGQLGSFNYDALTDVYTLNSLSTFMADMMVKYGGISWMSEFAIREGEHTDRGAYNTGHGITSQVGYLFGNNFEVAGRFTAIRQDGAHSNLSDSDEYTLGVSKYIVGHSLKVQSDVSRIVAPGELLGKYRFRMQMEMQF